MKLLISLLCLESLGVWAADSEWVAVLNRDRLPRGHIRRHAVMLQDLGATHQHSFELGSFRGYAFSGSKDAAERIAQHPEVAYVQPNHDVSVNGMVKEDTKNWNLGEISHSDAIGHGEARPEYIFDASAGNGTVVYVLDTGIDVKKDEFEGRAEWGITLIRGKLQPNLQVDDYGHGTHVAGVIGSRSHGVAKNTQLVAVKILDEKGSGKEADFVKGLAWAYSDAKRRGVLGRAIINASLGTDLLLNRTRDLQMDGVAAAAERGMFVVTAAGNQRKNALHHSPGAEPAACNVGAHDEHGRRASFSNFGPGVDVWAPGVRIRSLVSSKAPPERAGRSVASGTSSAAPHVAGVAAYLMGLQPPEFYAAQPHPIDWCAVIRSMGKGARERGGAEPLLYNGAEGPIS